MSIGAITFRANLYASGLSNTGSSHYSVQFLFKLIDVLNSLKA